MIWSLTVALLFSLSGAYGAGLTTAYDDDGTITVNGKRTFILGSYHYGKKDPEAALRELAEAGFNLVNSGADATAMDQAQAAGLMVWTGVGTLDLANRETSAAKLRANVEAVKNHPALAFLETVDEPAWTWEKAEPRTPAQALIEAYPLIKQADAKHLLYTNHAPTNLEKTLMAYNPGTDIVACDIYPVNPGGIKYMYALFPDGHQGDLNNEHISQVGEYTAKMRRVAGPNRPVFMVLQAFAWEALLPAQEQRQEKILFPSYAQTRFMAYQAIINGANGILYWGSDYLPQPSQAWTDLKRVVRELADLAEPLAAHTVQIPVDVDYHEMGHSVDDGLQVLAKEHDTKLYLLTCNADKNLCKATLSLKPSAGTWTTCRVLSEDRTLPLEQSSITDTWKRFDTHVYELTP
ncbi:MAG: hypothetical protein HY706_14705 [Candidatus Hydrogenedentes bacterium]|nr:hypothetical protein [Candidatus Hydrogenedentota bacterium]